MAWLLAQRAWIVSIPSTRKIDHLNRNLGGKLYQTRYWYEREFETVGKVQEIANQQGTPITTLSVAWVLANPTITSAILDATRI